MDNRGVSESDRAQEFVATVSEDNVGIDDDIDLDFSQSLIGVRRKTLDGMYDLYVRHARAIGFSARKSTTRTLNGVVKEKFYCCSCAGVSDKAKNQQSVVAVKDGNGKKTRQRRKPSTRTNCPALMQVKWSTDGDYVVFAHVLAHNHELTRKEWQHHHRCERAIHPAEGDVIRCMTESGMRPTVQYKYLAQHMGGVANVGHTQRDHINYVYKLKMEEIGEGDAQTVIDKLQERADDDPDFFFRYRVDLNKRFINVFWRDSMMKEDYELYGDVAVFDTTYRMNKYNLICGAFVGINNHWKNVMFGCAFIADEKKESFEWLFSVFKQSMGGKVPVSLFTDQDPSIANGIEKVFPCTIHRLCQWHLHQNAVSHFGSLKKDATFKHAFNKCLKGCNDKEEFEKNRWKMVTDYGLENDVWFQRLYSIKEKWSTTFSKDFFSAGILSSQRCESANNSLGLEATKLSTLTDCLGMFDEAVKRWRIVEEQDEFNCSRNIPSSFLPMCGLLKHASQVFTLKLFRDFEQEFGYAMGSLVSKVYTDPNNQNISVFEVCFEGKPDTSNLVTYCQHSHMVSCTCKNFEAAGWLCYHCIRVLHCHSVSEIPPQYIVKRWTKFAKLDVWDRQKKLAADGSDLKRDCIPWRYNMTRNYYSLVLKCSENKEAREILEKGYLRDYAAVEALFSKVNPENVASSSSMVLDPAGSSTKGRKSGRIKRHWEKKKQTPARVRGTSAAEMAAWKPAPKLF